LVKTFEVVDLREWRNGVKEKGTFEPKMQCRRVRVRSNKDIYNCADERRYLGVVEL